MVVPHERAPGEEEEGEGESQRGEEGKEERRTSRKLDECKDWTHDIAMESQSAANGIGCHIKQRWNQNIESVAQF
jgi:hypothetical protein